MLPASTRLHLHPQLTGGNPAAGQGDRAGQLCGELAKSCKKKNQRRTTRRWFSQRLDHRLHHSGICIGVCSTVVQLDEPIPVIVDVAATIGS